MESNNPTSQLQKGKNSNETDRKSVKELDKIIKKNTWKLELFEKLKKSSKMEKLKNV